MQNNILDQLNTAYNKCSDCLLHPEYAHLLNTLSSLELTEALVDFLCTRVTSNKHIWEIRFEHLRILLLNNSTRCFDLKKFFLDNYKKSRRLTMKLFFLRGYAMYATEKEIEPLINNFCDKLKSNHDYIDYEHILSIPALPYLVNTYKYKCFESAYNTALEEYEKIDPLLRGFFTLNENLKQINLLTSEEISSRTKEFLNKIQKRN